MEYTDVAPSRGRPGVPVLRNVPEASRRRGERGGQLARQRLGCPVSKVAFRKSMTVPATHLEDERAWLPQDTWGIAPGHRSIHQVTRNVAMSESQPWQLLGDWPPVRQFHPLNEGAELLEKEGAGRDSQPFLCGPEWTLGFVGLQARREEANPGGDPLVPQRVDRSGRGATFPVHQVWLKCYNVTQ